MKVFTAVVLIFGVFVFLGNPESGSAHEYRERIGDHEQPDQCRGIDCSQITCRQFLRLDPLLPCPLICQPGYSCQHGYIRESTLGRCIPQADCHP